MTRLRLPSQDLDAPPGSQLTQLFRDEVGLMIQVDTQPIIDADVTAKVTAEVDGRGIPNLVSEEVKTQVGPEVTSQVAAASTVTNAAAAAAQTAAGPAVKAELDKTDNPRLLQSSLASGLSWRVRDPVGQTAAYIDESGVFRAMRMHPDTIPDASVELAKLSPATRAGLMRVMSLDGATAPTVRLMDAAGRVALQVGPDGVVSGNIKPVGMAEIPVAEVTGVTPSRKLYANLPTGERVLVAADGDPSNPSVPIPGAIAFDSTAGRMVWTSATREVVRVNPDRSRVVCWGDSLTADRGWVEQLGTIFAGKTTFVNQGVPGQTGQEIAIRQGGYILNVSVPSGIIPASGPVAVTSTDTWRSSNLGEFTSVGTLWGIPGTITKAIGKTWTEMTFTRTAAGNAENVGTGKAPFIPDTAKLYENNLAIIAIGRNDGNVLNVGSGSVDIAAEVAKDVAAMVARIKPICKQYAVLGTISTAETQPTSNFNFFERINGRLRAEYGARFITATVGGKVMSCQEYLSQQAIHDLGITPNAADLTAIAGRAIPPSIMNPPGTGTHFSVAAGQKMAEKIIAPYINSIGWFA